MWLHALPFVTNAAKLLFIYIVIGTFWVYFVAIDVTCSYCKVKKYFSEFSGNFNSKYVTENFPKLISYLTTATKR